MTRIVKCNIYDSSDKLDNENCGFIIKELVKGKCSSCNEHTVECLAHSKAHKKLLREHIFNDK